MEMFMFLLVIEFPSLSAKTRYGAGTREILEFWMKNKPIREGYLIVDTGNLAGAGAHSYKTGHVTIGADNQ